jgi:hypothetical protein
VDRSARGPFRVGIADYSSVVGQRLLTLKAVSNRPLLTGTAIAPMWCPVAAGVLATRTLGALRMPSAS